MTTPSDQNSICCPKFDPILWEDKVFVWDMKKFIKDKVFTLFYMPINFGKVITRLNETVTKANAKMPDFLCLSEHTSKWNMDIFLAVEKEIAGANNTTLSGRFFSKVYEGPYKDTGIWCKDFDNAAKSKDFSIKKEYMWYTTCPKCAKKYGKNYVVILAQID